MFHLLFAAFGATIGVALALVVIYNWQKVLKGLGVTIAMIVIMLIFIIAQHAPHH